MQQLTKSLLRGALLLLAVLLLRPAAAQEIHACVIIPVREAGGKPAPGLTALPNVMVQKAVAMGGPSSRTSVFWPAGSTLRVRYLGGTPQIRAKVTRYAQEWTRYANLRFAIVESGPSDLRVSFENNGSSWSVVGNQARQVPDHRATMNFGWFTDRTPEVDIRRTVLHEFGHALGLLHEHQNPNGGIPWNEEAVYDFYARTHGWDRQSTYHNVIARQRRDETQYSAYDASSIMHYPVDPRLTRDGYRVGMNNQLSPTDMSFIRQLYPGKPGTVSAPTPNRPPISAPSTGRPTAERPTPTNRPTAGRHTVTISNRLGEGQRAELLELFVDGRKYVFSLRQGQRTSQRVDLSLPAGDYPYQVRASSVYAVQKRVWDGRRYVTRTQNRTVRGSGKGTLRVSGTGDLHFVGQFDRSRGVMNIGLAQRGAAR